MNNYNKKLSNLHLVKSFLLRDSNLILYESLNRCDHDLLIYDKDKREYSKTLVVSVAFPKPIVNLKSSFQTRSYIRDYDLLFAIQVESLLCWKIPRSDVPDFESLYLSKKYDSYRVSFLDLTSYIHNPELFESLRKERDIDKESLKEIDSYKDEENTAESILTPTELPFDYKTVSIKLDPNLGPPCSENEHGVIEKIIPFNDNQRIIDELKKDFKELDDSNNDITNLLSGD